MFRIFFFLLLLHGHISAISQSITPAEAVSHAMKERDQLIEYFRYLSADTMILHNLPVFFKSEVGSICNFITDTVSVQDSEKAKAIMSLRYFMRELTRRVTFWRYELYNIARALHSYKDLLKALLLRTSYIDIIRTLSPVHTQMLANTFWQYEECGLFEDFATYKRLASDPELILEYLDIVPGYRFADSLLLTAAAQDPVSVINMLPESTSGLQHIIANSQNRYVQQLVLFSKHHLASELLPFLIPVTEGRMTAEDILRTRADANAYFRLLVNSLINEVAASTGYGSIYQMALRNAIKEKSLSFYVNEINALHSATDQKRFASVANLRVEDFYYVITACSDELYTSSYLGLYFRMMSHFSSNIADSLFRLMHFDNFLEFMRMGAGYNTLGDFLNCMPPEETTALVQRFISYIESDPDFALERAMEVADSFTGLNPVAGAGELVSAELKVNLDRCRSAQLHLGVRLYSILLQVYVAMQKKSAIEASGLTPADHEVLKRQSLWNKKDEIIEQVLFYGDEDGVASFGSFIKQFNDPKKWKSFQNKYWVTIHSVVGQSITIYANLPLDNENQQDLEAQDSLAVFLQQQELVPVIVIHRGHSYHLLPTLKQLRPTTKLVILGSCGGYNNILTVAHISPDAQIIFSKKTGSKFINDPLIELINQTLLDKKDLVWSRVWERLTIRFRKDTFMLNLFSEYIPPSKNLSLFVLRMFYR